MKSKSQMHNSYFIQFPKSEFVVQTSDYSSKAFRYLCSCGGQRDTNKIHRENPSLMNFAVKHHFNSSKGVIHIPGKHMKKEVPKELKTEIKFKLTGWCIALTLMQRSACPQKLHIVFKCNTYLQSTCYMLCYYKCFLKVNLMLGL